MFVTKNLFFGVLSFFVMVLSVQILSAQQDDQDGFLNETSAEKFKLYPNPFKGGRLHIVPTSSELKNIMILNILGEVVFQTATFENYILPSNMNSGIYIVKIIQRGQHKLVRLVVP